MRNLLAATLALVACTADNPDYDPSIAPPPPVAPAAELPEAAMFDPHVFWLDGVPSFPAQPDMSPAAGTLGAECQTDNECSGQWIWKVDGAAFDLFCRKVNDRLGNRCCVETAPNVFNCAP